MITVTLLLKLVLHHTVMCPVFNKYTLFRFVKLFLIQGLIFPSHRYFLGNMASVFLGEEGRQLGFGVNPFTHQVRSRLSFAEFPWCKAEFSLIWGDLPVTKGLICANPKPEFMVNESPRKGAGFSWPPYL